ncbi:Derlin-1 [Coccomyxa subellipsoidea C-169]|uniref:Derlin n=1 Tax=Coccomyxa subellipsoidea (strain C-169) TaxID=574566 RepID=I0Z2K4_COCSC|nr:Derlin-1 [Coccomyxa subellipsoidea C-169]EIE24873.1 Derlin-1 [Coccomyxa subellipsoidea C-169]|eukprot:XP_005649417.1 Derlin-1 [Coccomyxa subellipsoidea C-169]
MPPTVHQGFGSSPADWYYSLPPIIRLYGTACVATTMAVTLGLINPMSLLLDWPSVFKGQIFRLVASFIFLGKPSINFLMKMLWMIQYGVPLEKSTYQFSTADFAYMLLFGMVSMLGASLVVPVQLLGPSLIFMMVYVWSRNLTSSNISQMGLVSIQAFYLPFALLALDLAMGGDWMSDLLGIIVGHLYYFLKELHPAAGGGRLLETPMWLKRALLSAGIGTVPAREVPMQHPSDAHFRAFAGRGRRLDD